MQNVNFSSLDDFLAYLPDMELEIVERLRMLIGECLPEAKEKLSYNVPYYFGHRRICFIWPATVLWGMVPMDGVKLGFCQGNLLRDEINYLEKGHRKQIYTKTFNRPEEVGADVDLIRTYLFEALEIDEGFRRR